MTDAEAPVTRVSKPVLIVLGVLAVVALVYLVLVLPNQGDGVDAVDRSGAVVVSEPAVVGSEPAVVVPDADASEAGDLPLAEPTETAADPSFEVFSARDPFEQLVTDDTGGAGVIDGTTETSAPTAPVDDTTNVSPPPADDPALLPPVVEDPAQTTVGTTTIMLQEIYRDDGVDTALVLVDNEGYEAAEGETVAGDLTVLDIEGNCATMRFDERRFILCEGEQIQK